MAPIWDGRMEISVCLDDMSVVLTTKYQKYKSVEFGDQLGENGIRHENCVERGILSQRQQKNDHVKSGS